MNFLKSHSKSTLIQTDKGQMAIFIALIFQVLFVLFAMSINIALVVHDKINLQNATDFAAYYGAQKQAEILNAMAHQNFQIRQAWKLLAFRTNVVGTLGVIGHPTTIGATADVLTFPDPNNPLISRSSICILFGGVWPEAPAQDNFCKSFDWKISKLPTIPIIAPFNPINLVLSQNLAQLSRKISGQCKAVGAYNWLFGAISNAAFRFFQMNNRDLILALGNTLKVNDFVTLDGGTVSTGAGKTLFKNLTFENRAGQNQPDTNFSMEILNSMAGIDSNQWLTEIQIAANYRYLDIVPGLNGSECGAKEKAYSEMPADFSVISGQPNVLQLKQLQESEASAQIFNNKFRMTLGVEKNPWYQVYFGVKASTAPREIFSPFNIRVGMSAKAFAKPFGGRIGPWYRNTWPKGATESTGFKVDSVLPDRKSPTAMGLDQYHDPNFSRFPGDQLGSFSANYMTAITNIRTQLQPKLGYFSFIYNEYLNGQINDPLAWDATLQQLTPTRILELSAIAPDLFDATYYSVIPNYSNTIMPKLLAHRGALGIPDNISIQGDLGSHGPNQITTIHSQLQTALVHHAPTTFSFIQDFRHLLTGWATDKYNDYEKFFPSQKFGQCAAADTSPIVNLQDQYKIPNSCINGGRSGYSVKMVSSDFLKSNLHDNSGVKGQPSSLLNPPPDGW